MKGTMGCFFFGAHDSLTSVFRDGKKSQLAPTRTLCLRRAHGRLHGQTHPPVLCNQQGATACRLIYFFVALSQSDKTSSGPEQLDWNGSI